MLEAIEAYDKIIGAFVCRDESKLRGERGALRGIGVGIATS